MKRYITISLSMMLLSLANMLTWMCMGFTMGNPNLSSVFSLMYPVWFIDGMLLSIFGTGANIRKNKKNDKTDNSVYSGIIYGILFAALIFVIMFVFSDNYVQFMHMDVAVYGNFAKFSMLQALAWLVFQLVLEKLYFEDKDTEANIHSVCFYVLSFVSLVVCSLITKNETIIIWVTLGLLFAYTIALFCSKIKKFKFEWNFLRNIKYDSVSLCSNLMLFITYFVGYSNAFEAGQKYVVAINLVNLVTDPQWDALCAIDKIAKIDLSRDDYNFKRAVKHSAILTFAYVCSSVVLFFSLYKVYGATLWIGVVCLSVQVADMLVDVVRTNLREFLHLEFSALFATISSLLTTGLRTVVSSVLLTPFNTNIAQITFDVVSIILLASVAGHFFKINKLGFFVPRKKKIKIDNIVLYVDRRRAVISD